MSRLQEANPPNCNKPEESPLGEVFKMKSKSVGKER
jgi:hypothetical protein